MNILFLKLFVPKSSRRIGSEIFALLTIFAPYDLLAEPLDTWQGTNPWPQGISLRVSNGNGIFVAVGESGALYTTQDGAVWIPRYKGTGHLLRDVAHGGGTFAAGGESGAIFTSPDGSIWTRRNSGTTFDLFTIAHGSGSFVAAGEGGPFSNRTPCHLPGSRFPPHL